MICLRSIRDRPQCDHGHVKNSYQVMRDPSVTFPKMIGFTCNTSRNQAHGQQKCSETRLLGGTELGGPRCASLKAWATTSTSSASQCEHFADQRQAAHSPQMQHTQSRGQPIPNHSSLSRPMACGDASKSLSFAGRKILFHSSPAYVSSFLWQALKGHPTAVQRSATLSTYRGKMKR